MSKVSGIQYVEEQKFDTIVKSELISQKEGVNLTINFFNDNPKAVSQKINEINQKEHLGKNVLVLQNNYFEKEASEMVSDLRALTQDKNNVIVVEEYAHLSPNKKNIILSLFDSAQATCFTSHHPDSARLLDAAFRGHSVHYGVELDVKPSSKMKF